MEKNIYAYVGLLVIAFLVVYLFVKALKYNSSILEGLTVKQQQTQSVEDIVKSLNKANEQIGDGFNISKNRTDIEDMLVALDEQIGYIMLGTCFSLAKNMPGHAGEITAGMGKNMEKLTNMQQVRTMLDDVLKFVDNVSTSSDAATSKITSFF
jgi:hypothetical protein